MNLLREYINELLESPEFEWTPEMKAKWKESLDVDRRNAELVQGVAHPDANIIFGTVVDESMGDSVRVTVIAAGFDRWDTESGEASAGLSDMPDVFGETDSADGEANEDEFDVPSFLK